MRYLKIISAGLIFLLFVSCLESARQVVSPKKEQSVEKRSNLWNGDISLVRLIANPENYHRKQITVEGYLDFRFERNAIYLHEDDFKNTITSNAFWVEFTKKIVSRGNIKSFKDLQKYSGGHYVTISGKFDMNSKGHMDLFGGEIFVDDMISQDVDDL